MTRIDTTTLDMTESLDRSITRSADLDVITHLYADELARDGITLESALTHLEQRCAVSERLGDAWVFRGAINGAAWTIELR